MNKYSRQTLILPAYNLVSAYNWLFIFLLELGLPVIAMVKKYVLELRARDYVV
jgi:hypothetical protein